MRQDTQLRLEALGPRHGRNCAAGAPPGLQFLRPPTGSGRLARSFARARILQTDGPPMTIGQKLQLVLIAGVVAGVATPAGVVAAFALAVGFVSFGSLCADRPAVARACLALALGALAMAHG